MAVFEYKALNKKGKKKTGIIDAESDFAAKSKLRSQKLYLVLLKKIESHTYVSKKGSGIIHYKLRSFSRVRSSELAVITRQLSTLLSAGFPLVKSVSTLIPQTKSKTMKKALSGIKDAIEEGSSFANALRLYQNIFSQIFINMVNAGESSGTLDIVLERLADLIENREDSKKKIQAAMAYPILMSLIALVVLMILMTYVIPGIVNIFTDMNQILPKPTRILIMMSMFFKSYWWMIILIPVLLMLINYLIRKTKMGCYFMDDMALRLPIAGPLLKKILTARITRMLGVLLENGVPMLTALDISRTIAGNKVYDELISKAYMSVEQGGELGKALSGDRSFPDLAGQMITTGEASGQIEEMLKKISDLFDKEIQSELTAATSIIEPMIILIMGVVVGCIIFAICLPIFEINQLIQ